MAERPTDWPFVIAMTMLGFLIFVQIARPFLKAYSATLPHYDFYTQSAYDNCARAADDLPPGEKTWTCHKPKEATP